jgi:hypothetical protein
VQGHNVCATAAAARIRNIINGYSCTANGKRKRNMAGLGGSFVYARIGDPLFTEYRDWGRQAPSFEELAKYVFYTETSREIDLKRVDPESGFIGATEAAGGTGYYLMYTPNEHEDREMSLSTLKALLAKDQRRNWVIYCEKIWVHQDELRKFEQNHQRRVRPMLVPFNLR